jgi:hypothetical protein
LHGGASLVSLNQRLLSSAFLHQALLLRPIHSNLPGGWKESEDSQIPIDQFTSSNSAVQAVRLKVRQKWKIVVDLISSIVLKQANVGWRQAATAAVLPLVCHP